MMPPPCAWPTSGSPWAAGGPRLRASLPRWCSPTTSNSRPLEFDSSWFAHSDSYSMIRHGLRAEKGVWWGCAAAKTSSKLTISDMFGELTAHRERDAGPVSRQSARRFLDINTRLRRILKDGPLPFDAAYESRQQLLHGVKHQHVKMVADLFPEVALGLHLVPGRLEQGTAQLLNLIYQEGQHHQQGQHDRQVLLAVSEIMLQVISLVLQGVERLILDLPAGSSPPHDVPDDLRNQEKVGDPTEMLN